MKETGTMLNVRHLVILNYHQTGPAKLFILSRQNVFPAKMKTRKKINLVIITLLCQKLKLIVGIKMNLQGRWVISSCMYKKRVA
ncbi:hypothetical protein B738_08406 [Photorhabdus temperata subsp. temperata M1021]|nr:hypothetical protein B738_08406 [Photorhabdus temperata subsp. temperata M1021]